MPGRSQGPTQSQAQPDKPKESEEGIPVTSSLLVEKCGACHKKDEKGNLSRISWERTTPEGWQQTIKRMVRLNGLSISPEQAREIVKYLSNHHGLAPEEAKPAMYIAERRMIDESLPNDQIRDACTNCHPYGRAMSWRRSREEWDLLVNMHLGYFPVAEFTAFRRWPPPASAPPPAPGTDTRDPVVRATEFIAKAFPLHTSEWSAWRAGMRAPKLSGRWLVSGRQPGRGPIYGEMFIEPTGNQAAGGQPGAHAPGGGGDEFTTSINLLYVKDGTRASRAGRAIIYTGYAWRGRSENKDGAGGNPELSPRAADPKEVREVMMVSRDQGQIEGRWFWGGYDEFGMDFTLRRAGSETAVLGLDRTALRTGVTSEAVRIFGDNFPDDLAAGDFDFGSGITVKRVVNKARNMVTVEVDVAQDAILGKRDVAVRRSVSTGAFAVFDKVDYLKVSPEAALARLGGATHPKGFQQFEAIGYSHGPDKKKNTHDDVNLGPVDVEWSLEEFLAVFGDDDKDFVGTLSPSGLFTPAAEGPNPKRKFQRNNYGDVWVVATYKPKEGEVSQAQPAAARSAAPGTAAALGATAPGTAAALGATAPGTAAALGATAPGTAAKDSKPVTGRGHLVVTVPLYLRWDQPEVNP